MIKRVSLHGHWSSRTGFILAVAGSAVGLGNIWKFPYITGENGGGAFVLVYLLCVMGIGLPIMMAEILLGRRGRRNPITTMKILGDEEAHKGAIWRVVGVNGLIAGVFILSFYSVIAGWSLAYIFQNLSGTFTSATAESMTSFYDNMLSSWQQLLGWHTLFMLMTIIVVARGVERGLERAVRVLMPALFIMQIILVIYAFNHGAWEEGVRFLFQPDWSKLTGDAVLIAMGQAFFTLSIGMGAVMAYGAYLPQNTSIVGTSVAVVLADTVVAILAGLIIFPIVFQNGLSPSEGEGLVFKTLPLAFGNMTGGLFFGTLFFLLVTLGAWTSSIGLIEPGVAWLIESKGVSRAWAAWLIGLIVWVVGLATVFSFNLLADFRFLRGTLFDNIDYLTTNIMLPLGGLLIAIFAGWIMCRNSSNEELDVGKGKVYRGWRFLTRWVAPMGVLLIFLKATGLLDRAMA